MSSSPFSNTKGWVMYWQRVPTNFRPATRFNKESPHEIKALNALAAIGLISGKQLYELFGLKEKRVKVMLREHKLFRHEMQYKGHIVPLYSLGPNGAYLARTNDFYKLNYWRDYSLNHVLKCMLFFQMYKKFIEVSDDVKIVPSIEPFTGIIEMDGKPFYIYVVRGDCDDLQMFRKWNAHFNERVIVITESLRHLNPILNTLNEMKVRVTLDQHLLEDFEDIQDLFYLFENGQFVKESD